MPTDARALLGEDNGPQQVRRATVMSCVINLASTCMGTGILALPAAYERSGFTAGTVLCLSACISTMFSLYLLVAAADLLPDRSKGVTFYALCEAALPRSGRAVDIAVLINCLGTATAFLVVAADCFSRLGILSREVCVLLSSAVVITPCFFRTMDMLKITSTIAVSCLLGISALILAFGLGLAPWLDPCPEHSSVLHGHCGHPVNYGSSDFRDIFCTLPLFINAFTCQQNIFNVIGELQRPTAVRKGAVIVLAPMLPMMLYLVVATAGYLTFGSAVASNVINSYPRSPVVAAARTVLGIVVLCNFPLQMFPARKSFVSLLDSCRRAPPSFGMDQPTALFLTSQREVYVTGVFLLFTCATASLVSDLGAVVSLIGSTGATLIALITPGGAYCLLSWTARGKQLQRGAAMLLAALGFLVLPSHFFCGS
jgi:amino acid permease